MVIRNNGLPLRGVCISQLAQLEDEEEVVKQEDAGEVVKDEEDKKADDLDLDPPSMDDIINDMMIRGRLRRIISLYTFGSI